MDAIFQSVIEATFFSLTLSCLQARCSGETEFGGLNRCWLLVTG